MHKKSTDVNTVDLSNLDYYGQKKHVTLTMCPFNKSNKCVPSLPYRAARNNQCVCKLTKAVMIYLLCISLFSDVQCIASLHK